MCASILHFRKERIMSPSNNEGIEKLTETERRYEVMRHKAMEMHLVNRNAGREAAFCGADAPDVELMGVDYYLEQRKDGFGVGNVCQRCKVLAMPLAVEVIEAEIEKHEAEGRFDVAEDYRELAQTLAKETGQTSPGG